MRLLVVRCLAFVVVQAVMRARGNAGRSDCGFSTVSVQSVLVMLRFASARIRSVRELWKEECHPFYR